MLDLNRELIFSRHQASDYRTRSKFIEASACPTALSLGVIFIPSTLYITQWVTARRVSPYIYRQKLDRDATSRPGSLGQ